MRWQKASAIPHPSSETTTSPVGFRSLATPGQASISTCHRRVPVCRVGAGAKGAGSAEGVVSEEVGAGSSETPPPCILTI